MRRILSILLTGVLLCSLSGCGQNQTEVILPEHFSMSVPETTATVSSQLVATELPTANTDMRLYFNKTEIPVTWEKCKAVEELMDEAANGDIIVSMSMYGGWEQVGSLGKSYTRDDKQMTAVSGDIVLYSGNQIVVFYGSNSWSYTKLGRMDLAQDDIMKFLSNGDIILTIRK